MHDLICNLLTEPVKQVYALPFLSVLLFARRHMNAVLVGSRSILSYEIATLCYMDVDHFPHPKYVTWVSILYVMLYYLFCVWWKWSDPGLVSTFYVDHKQICETYCHLDWVWWKCFVLVLKLFKCINANFTSLCCIFVFHYTWE